MAAKRGRPPLTQSTTMTDAERQQRDATRKIRLECLKLAVEMRSGVSKAPDLIRMADKLMDYANNGKVEEE